MLYMNNLIKITNNMATIGLIMIFCVGFVSGMYVTTQLDKCIDKRIYRDDSPVNFSYSYGISYSFCN